MAEQNLKRATITKWMNRSRFLQIEDALEIGKVRLFLGEYVKGQGMKANVYHFMDLDDARVVFDDLAQGQATIYKEYKGSPGPDGKPMSRTLKVKREQEIVWFEATNGPGKVMPTGAVQPAGKPTAQVSVGMPAYDARKIGHAVLAYIRAWEGRHLLRVKAVESGIELDEVSRGQLVNRFSLNQEVQR